MRILGPERTRRALWLMYSRLTSTPLHTAYTIVLLLSSITLLSLHLASLANTHVSLSKLVTLLNIARPEDSSVIVPTFSSVDGQPVLQLCNVGQSDCEIVTSASPSASSEVPQQADGGASSPAVPTTTAQQSNAEATPFVDVGVEGNGVVSVSSSSSSASLTISSTSSVASPLSSASSTSVSSSTSSSGLFIADVGVSTASSVSGSTGSSSSVLVEPTLVLLDPFTNASASSISTTRAIQETRATSTSEPARTTTTVVQAQPDNITSENRPPPPTTARRPAETSTQTSETTTSTRAETTTTTTTTATDATANDLTLSTSTTQTVPVLPTAAELTTAGKEDSGTETELGASQTVTISSSSVVPEATEGAGASIQVIPPAARSRIQLSPRALGRRAFSASPVLDSSNGSLAAIDVVDVEDDGGNEVTRLDVICALAMAFPESQLQQSQMEDLVLIVFYVWLAGVGLAAIINESTPHLITVFLSSLFALLWSGTQVLRTRALRAQFDAFITHGACGGVDVLPSYWTHRERLELPIVVLNALALLVFAGMSLGLLKKYHKKTRVKRYVYNVILVLRTAILLGMFFLGAASVLWVQQLFSATASAYGITPTLSALRAMGIVSIVLAIPLGAMGWWALKVEERSGAKARWVMAVFVVLDLFFVAQWTATFASDVYREVFTRWTFFAALSVGGFFLLVGSLGAGVVCWMRFGKALVRGSVFSEKLASEAGHVRGNSGAANSVHHDDFGEGIPQIREIPWDYTNSGAERAWEPFDRVSVRQSQFTTTSSDADRQSTAFSYGLRSPVPPVPRVGSFDSRAG